MSAAPTSHQRLLQICDRLHRRLENNGGRYWNRAECVHRMARAYARGMSLEDLERHARNATTWSRFFAAIDDWLDGDEG